MKLRIHENSLRLRLNRSEVAQLAETGRVESAIEFGPTAMMIYSVEAANGLASTRADYRDGSIRVHVPMGIARDWAATDRIEIAGEQAGRDGHQLSILVEKDFKCIHKDGEEDAETFPNPLAASR